MGPVQILIQRLSAGLQRQEYLLENHPHMSGVRGLLYAYSSRPYRLLVSKVVDHFLFVDWDNDLFGQKNHLVDMYNAFNRFVNTTFKVPHVLRMTIPNMAIIAISETGFDEVTKEMAERTYLVPFKGGEVGQFFLVDIRGKLIHYHKGYVRKQPGQAPLSQAQRILVPVMNKSLRDDPQ